MNRLLPKPDELRIFLCQRLTPTSQQNASGQTHLQPDDCLGGTRTLAARYQANKMNEDSDVMYRLLVQSVEDYAIYMLTPEGIVANWNAGAQRAKGYLRDEIVGKHFSCFYTPEDRASGWPSHGLETARATGSYEAEGWRLRKDGSRFWAHVIIEAVRQSGELLGFAKVTRDVSERRQYEQDLLASKERAEALSKFLDTVIANIPSSVI